MKKYAKLLELAEQYAFAEVSEDGSLCGHALVAFLEKDIPELERLEKEAEELLRRWEENSP